MKLKIPFLILFISVSISSFGQIQDTTSTNSERSQPSSLRKDPHKEERPRPPVDLYKIISIENDTTVVDTSLTVQKLYKYNYLRRDNFNLLQFANTGQTYNTLFPEYNDLSLKPDFGARARHFNYMEVEDIYYYEVPTPWTQLYYKSVFEQGQTLDAHYTMNTSKQFNFSIAYKGLRSLGKYQNILTSTGNFRFAFSYHTKDKRYQVRAHYVAQDLLNNENGGLSPTALDNFQNNEGQFDDRSTLEVNFENAESVLDGKRFYINQFYELLPQSDSLATNSLRLEHTLNFSDKFYRYEQGSPSPLFGTSFQSSNLRDRIDLEDFTNTIGLSFRNPLLGKLSVQVNHSFIDYGYNSVLILEDQSRIPNRLQGHIIGARASYDKQIGGFNFKSSAGANVSGLFDGYDLNASASYNWEDNARFEAALQVNSRAANYNHLLYQSSYRNYNWYNEDTYSNVNTSTLSVAMQSEKWLDVSASFTNIDNYAYFAIDPTDTLVNSFQASETVSHLQVKAHKELRWGRFALDNTIAYQQVTGGTGLLNVPEITTRNTLYYTDEWFDKALFIQTGLNLKYFTSYNMNGYDPVLAEFYVQNTNELGGFPLVDVFFNMKIQQTRVFFIAEHINSMLDNTGYFSAPGYPYRDFVFRFGLVWDFFL